MRIKTCGHTMGTPGMDIFQAIDFFSDIGHDGIEIRCAADGLLDLETADQRLLSRIRDHAARAGIEIACVTPYYREFVTPEERSSTLAGLRRAMEAAVALGCSRVRLNAGTWPLRDVSRERAWSATVAGVREACRDAAERGVFLCVENHVGTLTYTARETVDFVEAVGSEHVGILYDHYFVAQAGKESIDEALAMQAPYLRHVHVKDARLNPATGEYETCVVGQGEMDWPRIVRGLKDVGYEGYLSDEYEKHWRPELPDPEDGMRRSAAFLRRLI